MNDLRVNTDLDILIRDTLSALKIIKLKKNHQVPKIVDLSFSIL